MGDIDIQFIGDSAARFVVGTTSKLNNPYKNVLLIRHEEKAIIPCGIPSIFSTHPFLPNSPAAYPLIQETSIFYKKQIALN